MCGKIERNVTKALLWTIKNNYEQYNGDNTFSDDDRVVIDGLVTKHVPSITTEWAVSLCVGWLQKIASEAPYLQIIDHKIT